MTASLENSRGLWVDCGGGPLLSLAGWIRISEDFAPMSVVSLSKPSSSSASDLSACLVPWCRWTIQRTDTVLAWSDRKNLLLRSISKSKSGGCSAGSGRNEQLLNPVRLFRRICLKPWRSWWMGTGRFDLSHLALTRDVATLKKKRLLKISEMELLLEAKPAKA